MSAFAQSPEEMKAWQEYMTPSKMHEILKSQDGLWHSHNLMWTDPSAKPMETKGVMENKMIFEGRYQESNFTANMMGMPFEGKSITGFDNVTQLLSSIWIDNMGTGMMFVQGKYNEEKNLIEMTGNMTDPMSGQIIPVREVITFTSPTEQFYEMFVTYEGKEMKSMQIKYKKFTEEEEKEYYNKRKEK